MVQPPARHLGYIQKYSQRQGMHERQSHNADMLIRIY